jgi:hypothetical protein
VNLRAGLQRAIGTGNLNSDLPTPAETDGAPASYVRVLGLGCLDDSSQLAGEGRKVDDLAHEGILSSLLLGATQKFSS